MTVREIPRARLVAMAWLVLALVVAGVAAWEWKMRTIGLVVGDLDDSKAQWAVERRKIAAGHFDDVVLVGSSRILFDTNLDVFEEVSGRRPIQLALAGTNPRPILTAFANDPEFRSLVIVDVTPSLRTPALTSRTHRLPIVTARYQKLMIAPFIDGGAWL